MRRRELNETFSGKESVENDSFKSKLYYANDEMSASTGVNEVAAAENKAVMRVKAIVAISMILFMVAGIAGYFFTKKTRHSENALFEFQYHDDANKVCECPILFHNIYRETYLMYCSFRYIHRQQTIRC